MCDELKQYLGLRIVFFNITEVITVCNALVVRTITRKRELSLAFDVPTPLLCVFYRRHWHPPE